MAIRAPTEEIDTGRLWWRLRWLPTVLLRRCLASRVSPGARPSRAGTRPGPAQWGNVPA